MKKTLAFAILLFTFCIFLTACGNKCEYTCDNAGCQVTVGNPPKDTNPGTDLPIDTN